jgi:hypothetical protein
MLATFAFAVGRSDTAERCPNHAKCWRRCNVQLGFHARRVASPAFTMFCSLTLISVPSMEHGAQEDRAHRARGGGPPDPSPSWFARRGAAAATRAAAPTAAGPHRRVGSRRLSVGLPADASGELSLRVLKDAYRPASIVHSRRVVYTKERQSDHLRRARGKQDRITGIQLTSEARRGRETLFIPPIVSRSSR